VDLSVRVFAGFEVSGPKRSGLDSFAVEKPFLGPDEATRSILSFSMDKTRK